MNHRSDSSYPCRQGMALFGVLMILASLSLIAGTVYTVVKSNVAVTGHHKRQQESFFQADAGLHYVQTRLSQDLQGGTVNLNQDTITVSYSAPTGYDFDPVTNLTRLANTNRFLIQVTGRSLGASTRIEAILGQQKAMGKLGVFGDKDLKIQPGFEIYSYNSDDILNPTPSDSTGAAGVGSNESVSVQPGVWIDGTIFLGQFDDGTQASISGGGAIPIEEIPRVTPDPLGAIGGPLATSFAHYSNPANNDNADAGISGNALVIKTKKTFTLYPGYYYLDDLNLASQAQIFIESTPDDPVVIFLSGPLRCQPSAELFSSSGNPRGLYIFSNSTEELQIQPNSLFRGFVYAPYAGLKVMPGDDVYGVFWGSTIDLQPSGDLYIDNRLLDDFLSGTMEIVQWKEVR